MIGSEISGGARKLVAMNNLFINLERVLRIKINPRRGGFIEDVYFYDNETGDFPPSMKNIFVKNFRAVRGKCDARIKGLENSKVSNVHLQNCFFEEVEFAMELSNCQVTFENVRIGENFFQKAPLEGKASML